MLWDTGAEFLTVGFGQGCRPQSISLYTNGCLKLHANAAQTTEMLFRAYQFFGVNSHPGKPAVKPGSRQQSADAKSVVSTEDSRTRKSAGHNVG